MAEARIWPALFIIHKYTNCLRGREFNFLQIFSFFRVKWDLLIGNLISGQGLYSGVFDFKMNFYSDPANYYNSECSNCFSTVYLFFHFMYLSSFDSSSGESDAVFYLWAISVELHNPIFYLSFGLKYAGSSISSWLE